MHIDNLAKALALHGELKQWREALARSGVGVFKHAILRVADGSHGHQGQNGETSINLTNDQITPFIEEQIHRVEAAIRGLGIDF